MKRLFIVISTFLSAFLIFGAGTASAVKTDHLRIMSFNVRVQLQCDTGRFSWTERKEPAVRTVKKNKPDVIGLQEASYDHKTAFLAEMPQYSIVDRSAKPGTIDPDLKYNQNPILFRADKFELLDYGFFWLADTQEEKKGWDAASIRNATWVKLRFKKSGQIFFVFNAHFDHRGKLARLKSSRLMVSKIKEIAGDNAFVFTTGDYNMNPGDGALKPMKAYLHEANTTAPKADKGLTYNDFGNGIIGQFDHIFFRNAKVKSFKVISEGKYPVPYISDHYPIFSDFDISKKTMF